MRPKCSKLSEMTITEKRVNRSRRRFLLATLKGAAAAGAALAAADGADANPARRGFEVEPSMD